MKRLGLLLWALPVMGGDLILAERGKAADCTIVLPVAASASQRYAAEELRDYTQRLTGTRLPIETAGAQLPEHAILLGLKNDPDLGEDGFRLKAGDGRLEIVGSSVRGTLYGVYELLERFGGCRWYASWHTVVPPRDRLAVPDDLDDVQKPAFLCRDVHFWDMFKADFAARNRANGISHNVQARHGGNTWRYVKGLGNCHTLQYLLTTKEYGADHPEYFAFHDGKRTNDDRGHADFNVQLCLTNPDVLRIVTSNVLDRIRRDPTAKFVGISQNDNQKYCQCPTCAAVDAEEGSHAGTLVRFVNAVAEAVEREFPDKYVETLAYQYTRHLPKKTRPRRNVMPCLCSIECEFSRSMAESLCPDNAAFRKDIVDWGGATDFLYVWDYVTDFACYPHIFPNLGSLQKNVQFFRDHGVKNLFEQGACQGRHAGFAELKAWLLAKWLWNPDLPQEPLLDDFFTGYYGKGAPYVRRVFDEANRRILDYNTTSNRVLKIYQKPWCEDCVKALPDSFLEEAQGLFAQAAAAVKGEPPVYSYNVRMSAFSVDFMLAERLRWGRSGKVVDFVRQAAETPEQARTRQERLRALIVSLQARMKEAGDIRLVSGNVRDGHTQVTNAWQVILSQPVSTEAVPTGWVEEIGLSTLKPGEWTKIVDDPAAGNGRAVQAFRRGWVVVFPMSKAVFRPGRRYAVSARMRADVLPGRTGNVFQAGIYDPDRKGRKDVLGFYRSLDQVANPRDYVWYRLGEWRPENASEYLWIGNGQLDKNGQPTTDSVFVDAIRFNEVE